MIASGYHRLGKIIYDISVIFILVDQFILCRGDLGKHAPLFIHFGIYVEALEDILHNALLIVRIIYGESVIISEKRYS